jgi:hypothetical protein
MVEGGAVVVVVVGVVVVGLGVVVVGAVVVVVTGGVVVVGLGVVVVGADVVVEVFGTEDVEPALLLQAAIRGTTISKATAVRIRIRFMHSSHNFIVNEFTY